MENVSFCCVITEINNICMNNNVVTLTKMHIIDMEIK